MKKRLKEDSLDKPERKRERKARDYYQEAREREKKKRKQE